MNEPPPIRRGFKASGVVPESAFLAWPGGWRDGEALLHQGQGGDLWCCHYSCQTLRPRAAISDTKKREDLVLLPHPDMAKPAGTREEPAGITVECTGES
jgi:hypothetical protein